MSLTDDPGAAVPYTTAGAFDEHIQKATPMKSRIKKIATHPPAVRDDDDGLATKNCEGNPLENDAPPLHVFMLSLELSKNVDGRLYWKIRRIMDTTLRDVTMKYVREQSSGKISEAIQVLEQVIEDLKEEELESDIIDAIYLEHSLCPFPPPLCHILSTTRYEVNEVNEHIESVLTLGTWRLVWRPVLCEYCGLQKDIEILENSELLKEVSELDRLLRIVCSSLYHRDASLSPTPHHSRHHDLD